MLKIKKKKKTSHRLPTIEEMLSFKPKRADFEWTLNKEGLVEIKVPKFNSNVGKSFCSIVRKDNIFTANMDKIGSIVWKNCDGNNTVEKILKILQREFPNGKNIDQRLFLFVQQMGILGYINY